MTLLIWALATGAITLAAWAGLHVMERRARHRMAAREARTLELDQARGQMDALESRVEFAERLLAQKEQRPGAP